MKLIYYLTLFILFPVIVNAQKISDSLKNKPLNYLKKQCFQSKNLKQKHLYANASIYIAKKKENLEWLCDSYHMKALISKGDERLQYADSVIDLSKDNSNKKFPALAYILKANYYYQIRNFKKALVYSISGLEYSNNNDDEFGILEAKHLIGLLKIRMGENKEALKVFKENLSLIESDSTKVSAYIPTIFAIADIYTDLKQFDSASYYNTLGVNINAKERLKKFTSLFKLNQGVLHYYKQQYHLALDSINKVLPNITDKPNLSIAYFYLAKTFKELGDNDKMILNLKEVDSIFLEINDVQPELREAYELLTEYYKKNNDYKNQLVYINRLIKLDSILHQNEIYVNKNLIKKYDIPKLISEKEKIISKIKQKELKKSRLIIWLLSALLLLLIALFYLYNKKRIYKKRFLDIIEFSEARTIKKEHSSTNNNKTDIGISQKTVSIILLELEQFENNILYLNSELTLIGLAKSLNTNSRYLSKIINHYKSQSFTNYVNSLRVNYAIQELQGNPNFRKYTLLAIANDIGFKKTETFTKAFLKHKGITPSFFIKELGKHY